MTCSATPAAGTAAGDVDAALVRAVVGSGAELVITPDPHSDVRDGIAALLRYADAG